MNTASTLSPAGREPQHQTHRQHQLEEWGAHCSLTTCNVLDFLPLQCPECHQTFCSSHFKPSLTSSDSDHPCEQLILKHKERENSHTPVRIPNSLEATRDKKCSYIKCKTIMLAPINCPGCKLSYCPSHRLEQDHLCKSSNASSSSGSGSNVLGKNAANYSNLVKNYLVDSTASKSNPAPVPSSASKTSLEHQKNTSTDPNPFSLKQHFSKIKSNQRSKAELESQQKALEFRMKNNLLTEKDKLEIDRLNEERRSKKPPTSFREKTAGSKTSSSNDCCIV
ncbi:hypothetical protein PCASD_25913 [Puccinia coronata f. sp. avenae]|uniref:AN1-type domain-containing protein n=1 Tax=Puccinia coronata f. sp. avenae TaxID=200324 RepID=A0A2N5TKP5_9BASI|nr:hypothetical protein PCASD_25913 [Puccinia coronata f. sp. avenae]